LLWFLLWLWTISGWCFGTFFLWLSIYWEWKNHPNWRTHIFQRYTTN
jgi:hypothetical protein